jgi:glycosyltransferase involved in cell wall biosynthesis
VAPTTPLNRQVKVARIITRLNIGGPAIHAILLTQALNDSQFSSTLVSGYTAPSEGDMLHLARAKGVTPLMVTGLGREIDPRHDLAVLLRLYRLLRELRPTIVHTHMAKAGTVGRLAARLARVPIVLHTYHGHVFHSYFGALKTQTFIRIERALSRTTDLILTVGDKQREEILGYGIGTPDKLRSVPLGLELKPFVESPKYRGELRAELGIPEETRLVGIVGRLVPVKGHTVFLRAAQIVCARTPSVKFLIVGDGELRDELEGQSRELGIDDRVEFLGWRHDLPRVYADLDLVALSSYNEGSPVALIEAMAAGRAVLSTDVGGVSDVVSDGVNGILVPPRDPEAMAEAFVGLLSGGPSLSSMGASGREAVYPKYSIDRLVSDVGGIYSDLVNARE